YLHKGLNNNEEKRGRKRSARTRENIKKINHMRKQKKPFSIRRAAKTLHISKSSVFRILKKDLRKKVYKYTKAQKLTSFNKRERFKRSRALLKHFKKSHFENILFTDEKLFIIEQTHNHQNNKIWSKRPPLHRRIIERRSFPKSVILRAGVTSTKK